MDSQNDVRQLIVEFAKDNWSLSALEFINEDPAEIVIEEQDSIVNFVYRIASKDGRHSVIIKHGKSCCKKIPTGEVSLDRQVLEYNCLKLMESMIPGSVPKPYCLDRTHNIIAMEDLSDGEQLKDSHEVGRVDMEVAANLGHLLAAMHQLTSKSRISPKRWQELSFFRQAEVKSTLGKYLFEIPFQPSHKVNKLPIGTIDTYIQRVQELKDLGYDLKMLELYTQEKCFIHADCHHMSVFIKDGRTMLIDFEFGFLSHPAQNVGYIVMSYFFCFILANINCAKEGEHNYARKDLTTKFQQGIKIFLEAYLADSDMSDDEVKEFLTHTALFAGGIQFQRSMFGPSEDSYYFTDLVNKPQFDCGYRMMKEHKNLQTIQALITTLLDEQE